MTRSAGLLQSVGARALGGGSVKRSCFRLDEADIQSSTPNTKGGIQMEPYICTVCQYVYDPYLGDPDNGVPPGTPFADLPDDWVCPICGVGKEAFEPE